VWSTVDVGKLASFDHVEIIKVVVGCLVAILGHLTNYGAGDRDAAVKSLSEQVAKNAQDLASTCNTTNSVR
jgi:hypothetical protein